MSAIGEAIDDVFDIAGPSSTDSRASVIKELAKLTTDKAEDIDLRALMVYSTIVKHVKAGGTVKFIDAHSKTAPSKMRTLKVRLR